MPKKLTPRGSATPGPTAPGIPVQKEPAKKKRATTKKSGTLYARNLHHIPARVPLDSGRDLKLEPRGARGDMQPVNREEQEDSKLLGNLNFVIELITPAEAEEIIAKQATNQQASNTAFDNMRNELGKPFKRVITTEPFEQQGKTVASIENKEAKRSQQQRESIVSDGFAPEQVERPGTQPQPAIPDNVDPEQVADWIARNGSDDVLAQLRVSIAPTEKTD